MQYEVMCFEMLAQIYQIDRDFQLGLLVFHEMTHDMRHQTIVFHILVGCLVIRNDEQRKTVKVQLRIHDDELDMLEQRHDELVMLEKLIV